MKVTTLIGYLLGNAPAIRTIARDSQAFWVGALLVFITAFPRHYDQFTFGEAPARWLVGPILFSLISGTWTYMVAYGVFIQSRIPKPRPPFWHGWVTFMTFFWLTAPIAWLYAIPVERYFDPANAARANVTLMAIVSLWRVLLITRVLSVLTSARFIQMLCWVLVAASFEAFLVGITSEALMKRFMAGMAGLTNSPAEEVLGNAVSAMCTLALFAFPISFILSLIPSRDLSQEPWPPRTPSASRPTWLLVPILFWIGIAWIPQQSLRVHAEIDQATRNAQHRKALDLMSQHSPRYFLPSRPLPPKTHEGDTFIHLKEFLRSLQPSDPVWIHQHLTQRFDEALDAIRGYNDPHTPWKERSESTRISDLSPLIEQIGASGLEWNLAWLNLSSTPHGMEWLRRHSYLIEATVLNSSWKADLLLKLGILKTQEPNASPDPNLPISPP